MAISGLRNCSIKGIVNILAPNDELNTEISDFDAESFKIRTGISARKVDHIVLPIFKTTFSFS